MPRAPMGVVGQDCLSRLLHEAGKGSGILAVGASNGLVARCVEASSADLVVLDNSGYSHLDGLQSVLGNLTVGDANAMMQESCTVDSRPAAGLAA